MSSLLRIDRMHLVNFRCFEDAELTFEEDTTVIFAENGGGKTALLCAVSYGLQPLVDASHPTDPFAESDIRRVRGAGILWERAGEVILGYIGTIQSDRHRWHIQTGPVSPPTAQDLRVLTAGVRRLDRWPLIAYYGTQRLWPHPHRIPKKAEHRDQRWGGYEDCLDPRSNEETLLSWWREETFGDVQRAQRKAPSRHFASAVQLAVQRATPHVTEVWYDITLDTVRIRFDDNREATWDELSDGYHAFIALVADIARRAVILNAGDGEEAPALAEGIVLIDEIDLHLHPRWQRVVLGGLRAAFPKLQFVVTTHSPQVLSSALNRQVRRLVDWKVVAQDVHVQGRDSNAILREFFGTDDRGEEGAKALHELYRKLDAGESDAARAMIDALRAQWGDLDPELIRAEGFLGDEA